MKFRKKPVVIEAFKVVDACYHAENKWDDLPSWIKNAYQDGIILFLSDGVKIKTLEGMMKGNDDDWIIQGVNGELYPCKPDIFEKTYERVS